MASKSKKIRKVERVEYAPAVATTMLVPAMSMAERDPIPALPQGTLTAEKVPEAQREQSVSLLRALMPLIMVVVVIAMVGLMVLSGGALNPMMLIFPLMMGMSLLMMFSPQGGEDIDETRRTYVRHLGALRDKALENAFLQRKHALHLHPDPGLLWSLMDSRRLWERAGEDPDVLAIRVGLGTRSLCTPLQVPDSGATEDLDPVCAVSLRQIVRNVGSVPDLPIVLQLQAFPVIGITGQYAAELARAIIIQLCFHHGPEVLGLHVVSTTGHALRSMPGAPTPRPVLGKNWAKWLPHTRYPEQAQFQILVVESQGDIDPQLLDKQWATIIDVNQRPGSVLAKWAEDEGLIMQAGEASWAEPDRDVPHTEAKARAVRPRIAQSTKPELLAQTESGWESLGRADLVTEQELNTFSRLLTKYRRPESTRTTANDIPRLLGIDRMSVANLRGLWQPRGSRRLAVPIGLSQRGSPLIVDIKEAAHGGMGPHGLCVGATGSGKSELLRTLVVAQAATHSPNDLNFVLVDFKGGATFLGLEELPHTSAVITNLEEETILVERMHDAIAGEMNRRQELLRRAGNFANVGQYTVARAKDESIGPPLPALFIVVDEFSELLGQHPDFADLFVAVGRLGRSLHIHLLLASQRLEEGRLRGLDSHLSYRIGLKTFSGAESRQVLGVVDAYHLPNQPGSGFLKTASSELTQFRASYVSGPLMIPQHDERENLQVTVWNGWEDVEIEEVDAIADPRGRTLVDATVQAAQALAKELGQSAHKIWLDPLPAQLPLGQVLDRRSGNGQLCATLGIIDRPYHQRQDPFELEFSGQGGHGAICGGPQTGKTTALRSLVLSLALSYPTTTLRFYILDLAGTGLAGVAGLAHVAGIAHRNEEEKVRRIIDEVHSLIERPEPQHTFLIIDGWHVLGNDFEDLIESVTHIAADGLAARIHLVVSTPRWNNLRPAVRDLIVNRIELKLGEALDSLIDRKAQQKLPQRPGLGLTADGELMLLGISGNQDIHFVHSHTQHQQAVPALKLLPQRLDLNALEQREGQIIVGRGGRDLDTLYLDAATGHLLIVGSQGSGKSTALRTIMEGIARLGRERARIVLIDHRRTHLGALDRSMLAAYSANTSQTQSVLKDLVHTLQSRLPGPDITPQELSQRSWWQGPDLYLCIDDYDLLADATLNDIRQLLPHARDIGLHVMLARKSGGIQRALFQPFLAELKDQSPAVIILDADREDGPLFGVRPRRFPPGRAQLVLRGNSVGTMHIAQIQDPAQGAQE